MNKNWPNFANHPILNKLYKWNSDDQMHEIMKTSVPQFTEDFRRKEMMTIFGNRDLDRSKSINEQIYDSKEYTREELGSFNEFE